MSGPRGEGTGPDAPEPGATVTIAAALSPADANAARDALLAALAAARGNGAELRVELDGPAPWPCAVQLLAAAGKSACAAGVPFCPGPVAAPHLPPPAPGAPQ